MHRRAGHYLLIMLVIALAAAPLRGVFALPAGQDAGELSHCEMMQAGLQAPDHGTDQPANAAGEHCPACLQDDCPGDSCAGHCAAFLHVFVALGAAPVAGPVTPGIAPAAALDDGFSNCTTPPLYRPPILSS
jgi:hypothetical protein